MIHRCPDCYFRGSADEILEHRAEHHGAGEPVPTLEGAKESLTHPFPPVVGLDGAQDAAEGLLLEFVVVGDAKPAGSKRAFVNPKTGRAMISDASKDSKPWKQEVRGEALEAMAGAEVLEGALFVALVFYRARPKAHFGKRGLLPSAPEFPTTRPDVDKLSRAVLDALTGVVWRDDAQVVMKTAVKLFGVPARVEIAVAPARSAPTPAQDEALF